MKKSWSEKLADDKGLPRVFEITGKSVQRFGPGTMVIPAPREVDALMKRVPRGRLATINVLREVIARRHKAGQGCPITTGIFAWISAHAAAEAEAAGVKRVTPYWRTLKNGGELNAKYPGGVEAVARKLEEEGHVILWRGKRAMVIDFEKRLVSGAKLEGSPAARSSRTRRANRRVSAR